MRQLALWSHWNLTDRWYNFEVIQLKRKMSYVLTWNLALIFLQNLKKSPTHFCLYKINVYVIYFKFILLKHTKKNSYVIFFFYPLVLFYIHSFLNYTYAIVCLFTLILSFGVSTKLQWRTCLLKVHYES